MTKVLFCVGNPQKGDDIVALRLGEDVEKELKDWVVIYGEDMPENHLHKLRELNADIIVVADASLGIKGAEFLSLEYEQSYTFSTHNVPLPILIRYIGEFCPKVLFLGLGVLEENLIYKENFLSKDGECAKNEGFKKLKKLDKVL